MNVRDELEQTITDVMDSFVEREPTVRDISAAVIAEGWRKVPTYEDLWNLIAAIRDAHPRRVDDAPTDEIVTAILALMDGGSA